MADTPRQATLKEMPRIATEAVSDLAQYVHGVPFEMVITVRLINEDGPDDVVRTSNLFDHSWSADD